MKKAWSAPKIETMDVRMTRSNTEGFLTDAVTLYEANDETQESMSS